MFRKMMNVIHLSLAKSTVFSNIALLIRNQCNAILSYHISSTSNRDKNGEKTIVGFLSKYCSVVFDIGANKGEWCDHFLVKNPVINIFLFEPSSEAFKFLQHKYAGDNRIKVFQKAIGEKESEVVFFEEPGCGETSSLVAGFSSNNSIKKAVAMTTVDIVAEDLNIQSIDFLKIDIEGYDLMGLSGAAGLLQQQKIRFIQFEYNAPWAKAGCTLYDAINFLNRYDYIVYILRNNGLYHFNYNKYGEFFRYSNFFALPKKDNGFIHGILKGSI